LILKGVFSLHKNMAEKNGLQNGKAVALLSWFCTSSVDKIVSNQIDSAQRL
jgi:hypothetical protein